MAGPSEYPFKVYGNLSPSRFVKVYSSTDFTITQCSASTDRSIGISTDSTKYPQVDTGFGSGASTYNAESGDFVRIFCPGEICLLEVNNAGTAAAPAISPGDWLIPDTNGRGIKYTTTASGGEVDNSAVRVGAVALEAPTTSSTNSPIRVMVALFSHTT